MLHNSTILKLGVRTNADLQTLLNLWEQSVRATHNFLTEADITKLIPIVNNGLSAIETLVIAKQNDTIVAFIGIDNNKIEMLFVSPLYFGQGIGKELVQLAIREYNVCYVDVNEQNPAAAGFYQYLGFKVFDRTDCDDQGNPFPILKLKL